MRRCGERSLVVDHWTLTEFSLWRHDLARPGSLEKVMSGRNYWACTPADERIAYRLSGQSSGVFWRRTWTSPEEVLVPKDLDPVSWAPGGTHLILVTPDDRQVWAQAMAGPEPRLSPLIEDGGRQPEVFAGRSMARLCVLCIWPS